MKDNLKIVTISNLINRIKVLKENPELERYMIKNSEDALVEITSSTRTFIDEFGTVMLSFKNINDLLLMLNEFKTKENTLENFENMFELLLNKVDFVDSIETSNIIH